MEQQRTGAIAMQPIQTLLTEIVDYAGLFPPAKLDMGPTVENYASYIESEHNWMLGRLIVPVSRLDAFEEASATLLPKTDEDAMPWRISALVPPADQQDPWESFQRIDEFNERHSEPDNGLALVDTVEIKTDTPKQIDEVLELLPEEARAFFEIPIDDDPRGLIAAIAGTWSAAKVRTGNVVRFGNVSVQVEQFNPVVALRIDQFPASGTDRSVVVPHLVEGGIECRCL